MVSALAAINMPNEASDDWRCALETADARVGLECRGEGLCTFGADEIAADAASTRPSMASAAHMLMRSMLGPANAATKGIIMQRAYNLHPSSSVQGATCASASKGASVATAS